jgi:hypothetical protein
MRRNILLAIFAAAVLSAVEAIAGVCRAATASGAGATPAAELGRRPR